jgi:hypothetical protein
VQHVLRQAEDVAPLQPGAQQQGQQLGVGQGAGAAGEQLLARALVGGQLFRSHGEGGRRATGFRRMSVQSIREPRLAGKPLVNTVQPGSFLTLHYRLSGPDGADVVNTFGDKPATLSLGRPAGAGHRALLIGLPEGAHQRFDCRPAPPSASATPSCCSV